MNNNKEYNKNIDNKNTINTNKYKSYYKEYYVNLDYKKIDFNLLINNHYLQYINFKSLEEKNIWNKNMYKFLNFNKKNKILKSMDLTKEFLCNFLNFIQNEETKNIKIELKIQNLILSFLYFENKHYTEIHQITGVMCDKTIFEIIYNDMKNIFYIYDFPFIAESIYFNTLNEIKKINLINILPNLNLNNILQILNKFKRF